MPPVVPGGTSPVAARRGTPLTPRVVPAEKLHAARSVASPQWSIRIGEQGDRLLSDGRESDVRVGGRYLGYQLAVALSYPGRIVTCGRDRVDSSYGGSSVGLPDVLVGRGAYLC